MPSSAINPLIGNFAAIVHDMAPEGIAAIDVQALVRSEARYRSIAESATEVIATAGLDGVVQYVSPSVTRVLGFDPAGVIGQSIWEYLEPDDRVALDAVMLKVTVLGEHVSAMVRVAMAGAGRRRYRSMELHAGPLVDPESGTIVGIRGLLLDVPEREEAGVELQDALVRANEALRVRCEADEVKDVLLLAVAHDLRGPVAAAALFAEVLTARGAHLSEDELAAISSGITGSITQLSRILFNLLDFERLVGGHVTVARCATDLRALIAGCVDRLGLPDSRVTTPCRHRLGRDRPGPHRAHHREPLAQRGQAHPRGNRGHRGTHFRRSLRGHQRRRHRAWRRCRPTALDLRAVST